MILQITHSIQIIVRTEAGWQGEGEEAAVAVLDEHMLHFI